MPSFTIRNAREEDFEQLYAFVFDKPDPNILKRSRADVRKMIANGVFFIAIDDNENQIIGSCYVKADSEKLFEFGGAFVDKTYRDHGIFHVLGLSAIMSHFLGQPGTPLIAHVVSDNDDPVNALKRLMFRRTRERDRFHKSELIGCEHMKLDPEGYVYGDTYEFQQEQLVKLAREAEKFAGSIKGKAGTSHVNINLPTFDKQILKVLRESLETER